MLPFPGMTGPTLDMACPHCFRNGFVHVQHVIRGEHMIEAFRCTACDYEWEAADDPDRSDLPPGDEE